jgi:hypothetical protein
MKKGDLSKFVEEAVRWRVFQRTVQDIKQATLMPIPPRLSASLTRRCGKSAPNAVPKRREPDRSHWPLTAGHTLANPADDYLLALA